MGVETSVFGKTKNGETVSLYRMYNDHMEIAVTDYGACLVEVWFRDKRGRFQDIVWGYDSVEQYEVNEPGFGATIGRNANRIGGAEFSYLEGKRDSRKKHYFFFAQSGWRSGISGGSVRTTTIYKFR